MKLAALFYIIFTLLAAPSAFSVTPITTLYLKEKAGVTSSNYPLTFGHVFKMDDVRDTVAIHIGDQKLPTQMDIKTTYTNGSVRFAVITIIIPSISSGQVIPLTIVNETSSPTSGPLTKAGLLATNVGSIITLSNILGSGYSGSLTADLRAVIENSAQLSYWLEGPLCTEILVKQNLNLSLNAAWEARVYPTTRYGTRISNTIENVNADYRGHIQYETQIDLGFSPSQTVYQKPSTLMLESSRWRKVLWLGEEPPETELRYDINYLISTGAVMNYNTSLIVPESIIAETYARWQNSDHDIMENGIVEKYFPTTGGREDIGILPTWSVRYLLTMDNRLKEIMLNSGQVIGSAPAHYRESNNQKSFFSHPISIDDRPTIWTTASRAHTFGKHALPSPIGDVDSAAYGWYIDRAHQGSFSYLPYLITGDYFFLEEMYYLASWSLSASDYNATWGRDYATGLIQGQVRAEAWAFRNLVDAAAFAQDGSPEKKYYVEKINNNINKWKTEENKYPLGHWGIDNYASTSGLTEEVKNPTSPWMEDFMLLSLVHAKEQQFDTDEIIDFYSNFIINRFTNPDFNWFNGAPYRFPAKLTDDTLPQSFAQANALFTEQPTSFPTDDSPGSYRFVALSALSTQTDKPLGLQGYTWLKQNVNSQDELNTNPTWAIVPRNLNVGAAAKPYIMSIKIQ